MRKIYLIAAMLLCFVGPARAFELTVLHVNDSHSYLDATDETLSPGGERVVARLGGWARLATAVDRVRREKPNVVLLHAGDAVQGGLYFREFGGEPEMRLLDRLGFDAMVLGNHEFDKGAEFLAGFLRDTDVPVLAANVSAPGVPALAARLRPYVILFVGGERVGVVGLTTGDTKFTSSPGPGVSFADEAATARARVAELTALGVDKVILLTHVGLDNDRKLAAAVPGVDVIVGGHSHTLLGDTRRMESLGLHPAAAYPVVVQGVDGHDVYIVTAWKWARVLGRLDVTFDRRGRVTGAIGRSALLLADEFWSRSAQGEPVRLSGAARRQVLNTLEASRVTEAVPESRSVSSFLAPYARGVEGLYREVIGRAESDIPHIRVPGRNEAGIDLPDGSLLAPLVARSMLDKLAGTGEPADIALMNAGGVRDSLARGDITVGAVRTLLPFANTLYTLELTGAVFRQALEYGVTRGGGAFPYLAGARYRADMTRPEGSRITAVEVRDAAAWRPLEAGRTYRVVTPSFLAGGGDGYGMLKDAPDRYDTGFDDAQAFMDLVMAASPLSPPGETGVMYIPAQ
ncbi:MAG: 5'-nucleotidase C-terminal domain-containing protein [Pseudodesulfovibrio sp.]